MDGEQRNDPRRRLTVAQAADQLGISVDAMRARVKRGTVTTEREAGRVYVFLYDDQDTDQDAPRSETRADRTDELISTLREQLQAERQAHAEARRIIAGLVERIPAIEAPQDADVEPEREEPRPDAPGAQEGTVRRPWWRRIFGGGS
jgi:hypothetical protein